MRYCKTYPTAWVLLLLLSSFVYARGQTTIPITASANPVCRNATATYTAPRTGGYTYVWNSSPKGNVGAVVNSSATTSAPVTWVAAGAAYVTVSGYQGTTLKEQGTFYVAVAPRPTPHITLDTRVGCQNLQIDTPATPGDGGSYPPPMPPLGDEPDKCMKVCALGQTVFTAQGAPGSTFIWSVTGGSYVSSSANTCTVSWGAAGPGSITVTETTVDGCQGSTTECIEIIPSPEARFFALPDSTSSFIQACLDQTIVFVDRSSAGNGSPIVTWIWNFGDGYTRTASGSAPDTHRYSNPGIYTVTLTVINQCNCRNTFQMEVEILNQQGVNITCPSVVCEGAPALYRTNVACGSYQWSVVGGTILNSPGSADLEVVWDQVNTSGFGYVYFDNTGNCGGRCPGVSVVKVPVIQQQGTIDGPAFICANKAVLYRMPQWPTTTFDWTASDPTVLLATTDQRNEILLTAQKPGPVTLICKYYNTLLKCEGIAELVIEVTEPPLLSGPTKACTGTGPTFHASVSGNWAMTVPNGATVSGPAGTASWTPTFPTAGIYRIYTTGSYCPPEPLLVTVKAPPPAPDSLLGPAAACTHVPVQYRAANGQSGTFFSWSGSGSTTLNAATGTISYATFSGVGPDVISVRRSWMDLPGCLSAPLDKTVTRPPGAPVLTGNTTPCANSYETYTAGPAFTDADDYEWTILPAGAGSVSAGQHTAGISVLWNNTATNTAAVLRLKARRCDSTYIQTLAVNINGIPALNIVTAANPVCANQPVSFSVTPGVSGSFSWDLGQTIATGANPTHTYTPTSNGNVTYPISVTVTNVNGCTGTATASTTLTVKPAPMVSITPAGTYYFCNTSAISLPTLIANERSGFGGPVSTVNWYYNGAPTTAGPQPAHTYGTVTQFGSYYAVLTNPNGCSSQTDVLSVINYCGGGSGGCSIAPGDSLHLGSPAYGCATATLTSNWTAGVTPGWQENSGHSTYTATLSGNSSTATFTFDEPGIYPITASVMLPATGGGYCLATKTRNVLIPYVAGIRTDIKCAGTSYDVKLLDASKMYPPTPITTYAFYEGSTLLSSGAATSVTLPPLGPGNHVYTLVISDGTHAPCTASVAVNLPALPSVSIAASRTIACVNDAVIDFTPTVTPAGSYRYLWDFGDGPTNTQQVVAKVYSRTGFKIVQLQVSNLYGCTGSASVVVDIKTDELNGAVNHSPLYPCEGEIVNVFYTPTGTSTPTSYEWRQPPLTTLLSAGSSLNVANPGAFLVKVEDMYGCVNVPDVHAVNFRRIPDPAITGDTSQCDGAAFTLNGNLGPGAYTYHWYRDGSPIQSGPDYELAQSGLTPGTYSYTLTVETPNPPAGNCAKTSKPFVVTVHNLPAAPWINPPNPISCSPYTLELSAGASVPGTFNWSDGSSGTPVTVYSGGHHKVYFTDAQGCRSEASALIPGDPNAYLWIFPTGCFYLCSLDGPFRLVGPQAWFSHWDWQHSGSTGLAGNNSFVSPYQFSNAGTYNLSLQNSFCTVQSGNMNVDLSAPCAGETRPAGGTAQRPAGAALTGAASGSSTALTLSPNPAAQIVSIHYSSSVSGNIEVYDVLGRKVASQSAPSGEGSWQLDVSAYVPGIYRVVLRQEGRVVLHQSLSVQR